MRAKIETNRIKPAILALLCAGYGIFLPSVQGQEEQTALPVVTSKIGGRVFLDLNDNDVYDREDRLLHDLEINLIDIQEEAPRLIHTVRTNDEGKFKIQEIPTGVYKLRVTTRIAGNLFSESFEIEGGIDGPEFDINISESGSEAFRFFGRAINPENTTGDVVSPSSPEE